MARTRRLRSTFLTVITMTLLVGVYVRAQERAGSISGTVVDAGQFVLPGARIELEPKGPAAVSDQQGRFSIQNLQPGDYTVTISYVGLLPYTEKVTVAAVRACGSTRFCRWRA